MKIAAAATRNANETAENETRMHVTAKGIIETGGAGVCSKRDKINKTAVGQ